MNIQTKLQTGFTLMEVLVGVTLFSFVFLSVMTATVVLVNSNSRVKQIDHLEQAKNDLQLEFANSIRWAKTITLISPSELTITHTDGSTSEYKLDTSSNRITKNGTPITSDTVDIVNFEINDYSRLPTPSPRSLQLFIEMQHQDFSSVRQTFRLVVSQRVGS